MNFVQPIRNPEQIQQIKEYLRERVNEIIFYHFSQEDSFLKGREGSQPSE
ncbi:hypothetical protein ABH965_005792 [Bacillus sp. RC97]